MNNLDQNLRDYYASQLLPPDRVAYILESGRIVRPRPAKFTTWLAAAAAVVVLLAGWALLSQTLRPSLQMLAAAEVAKNHSKQLAPEIMTTDFAQIQVALPRLDFAITPTQADFLAGLRVLGGRYCSIQGELAAQISLQDTDGKPCTLYIAPLTPELAQIPPVIRQVGETQVQFWHDAHRLYALAR